MESLARIIAEHPLFKDLKPEYINLIVGCASNVRFEPGSFLFHDGDPANVFYIIRTGKVAVELYTPNSGPIAIETVEDGDVVGWSWLVPPYKWHFDARALELTRAIAMDGACLRGKCDDDHHLGYQLMQRFAQIMQGRLRATRLQLMDVYSVKK